MPELPEPKKIEQQPSVKLKSSHATFFKLFLAIMVFVVFVLSIAK